MMLMFPFSSLRVRLVSRASLCIYIVHSTFLVCLLGNILVLYIFVFYSLCSLHFSVSLILFYSIPLIHKREMPSFKLGSARFCFTSSNPNSVALGVFPKYKPTYS